MLCEQEEHAGNQGLRLPGPRAGVEEIRPLGDFRRRALLLVEGYHAIQSLCGRIVVGQGGKQERPCELLEYQPRGQGRDRTVARTTLGGEFPALALSIREVGA